MKIRMICTCMLAATMLLACPLFGQADVAALQTALQGKPLGLRSYSADPVAKFTYVDGKLISDPIVLHGVGAFFTDTVRQKGSKVLIEGQYSTLVLSAGKPAPMEKLPMRLEVELQGANAATVIPQLQALLFFPSLGAALKGLPEYVADMLPFPIDVKFQPACHCFHVSQDAKWTRIDIGSTNFAAPVNIKKAVNPGLDQMAIDEKLSGTITLIYLISDTGRVDEVWLAKPLSATLDESAAKSERDNIFQPATLDGKPVGTVLVQTIPVN
jgi:Gram-negative bacterial TonB protein C-terminal